MASSFRLVTTAWTASLMLAIALVSCGGKPLEGTGLGVAGTGGAAGTGGGAGVDGQAGTSAAAGTGAAGTAAMTGAAGTNATPGSPGTVTLRLNLAPSASFCDATCVGSSPEHITIFTLDEKPLTLVMPWCATLCGDNSCTPARCPAANPCLPLGLAFNGETLKWDGRAYKNSTCGAGVPCYSPTFVPAGTYVARMCATPGTLTPASGCTVTGPLECVDVPFDLPGKTVAEGTLGRGVVPSCHAMRASDYDQSCQVNSDCVFVTEGDFCGGGDECTDCSNAPVNAKEEMRYMADFQKNSQGAVVCPCVFGGPPVCTNGKCGTGALKP